MVYEVITVSLAICSVFCIIVASRGKKRNPYEPPYWKGNFLLGVSASIARDAVGFLRSVQKQLGDVVSMRLLYLNVTFFLNPHDYEAVLNARTFDYHPVFEMAAWRFFGAWSRDIRDNLKIITKGVRGPAIEISLGNFSRKIANVCEGLKLEANDWRTESVVKFTSKTMFSSLYNNLFDEQQNDANVTSRMFKNYTVLHHFFNYLWIGMPRIMFPSVRTALHSLQQQPSSEELLNRQNIPEFLRNTHNAMKQMGHTEIEIKHASMVFLYIYYNVNKLASWVLYFTLRDVKVKQALLDEVETFKKTTGKSQLFPSDVGQLPILESVMQESLRLAGRALVLRQITKDTTFETCDGRKYFLRKGDHVATYPWLTHNDPEVFINPEKFVYDRFIDAKFTKNGKDLLHPVTALGACPAKSFAKSHIKLFILSMLTTFDIELQTDSSDHKYEFSHEIAELSENVIIRYRTKCDVTEPTFANLVKP